jgi:hypothetical protein
LVKPEVDGAQLLLQAQQVERWPGGGRSAKVLTIHLAAERQALQVEEPCGALDIGQRVGRRLQPPKNLPAGQRPLEAPDELVEVVLDHPVEPDQLAMGVVQDLHLGGRLQKEDRRRSAEQFDVAAMRRQDLRRLRPIC